MSWLLFLDESGHDHKTMPYEVRGGVALHAGEVWPFVLDLQRLELDAFGASLHQYRKELKGSHLLDKDRFRWAAQSATMEPEERRKHARGFLTKGLEKKPPSRHEFTGYGQACIEMARGIFQLLRQHRAVVFGAVIPCNVNPPTARGADEYLRKDHVFLLERFSYFLEGQKAHGLLVMDEAEKTDDRRFVRRLQSYFARTLTGRYRAHWIVPVPLFVASDMTYPIQAADVCIYALNWGFRLPGVGMVAPARLEIAEEFGSWLTQLQFCGEGYREGRTFQSFGIVFVPDPYTPRSAENKKGDKIFGATREQSRDRVSVVKNSLDRTPSQ